jgi:gamma-glutamyltranspeptidase/glutathione hydrolase
MPWPRKIDPRARCPGRSPRNGGYLLVRRGRWQGQVVSAIQSTYFEFGSGLVLPKTGITWQNRGASFRLAESGWNALKPGASRSTRSTPRWRS